ncbi:MAG: cupin domain-containing protein [Thaumarchaeota archaeon]|nr:cupin domain-containing protein [Nitrososphaerota archaeon]
MARKFKMMKFAEITDSFGSVAREEYAGTIMKKASEDLGVKHFKLNMTIMHPGNKIPSHSHPTAEEVHLLMSGKSTVTVDGEVIKAEAITAFYMPPGSKYALINDSKADATWVFIGAPVDEYVKKDDYKWVKKGKTYVRVPIKK